MSSPAVRTLIKTFLADELPDEEVVDLTARYEEISEMLEAEGLTADSKWLGLQFIGDEEIPVGLTATNDQGKYRETGSIYFHFVEPARIGNGDSLLTRSETLRNLLRGQRIGGILVETMTLLNTDAGATLQFEKGFMSGSFLIGYQFDLDL